MQIFKKKYKITGNKLIIDLPEDLKNKRVEVIINSSEEQEEYNLNQLLNITQWTEDDVRAISESRKQINKWKIQDF